MLRDSYNRRISDLRVSITDRCNFRCFYCDPHPENCASNGSAHLTFEEIEHLCAIFVSLGIEKIRITGGEPMVRKDVEVLVAKLANLKLLPVHRLRELAMITNGSHFAKKAVSLRSSGLDRVTFSLDSLKPENFRSITGTDKLNEVLDAIASAHAAGYRQTKVNAVIVRGRNDTEIVELARFARENDVAVRFIEFMPLDGGRSWDRTQLVAAAEIRERINEVFPLALITPSRGNQTAWRYRFADGAKGEIGLIAPVTNAFCGACSRIRLTADGQIRTCLFSRKEYDLKSLLRAGATRREIVDVIQHAVANKEPGHTINAQAFKYASRTMSAIGG
jgi:cyclic pyranopterin phosphate synthase